ncbi:MAG: CoA ester lyase [Alphaproteobacteria bacterium]
MLKVRPRRSVLYIPGANRRAIDKARTLPADAIILDLEDAVAPEAKAEARETVADAVKAGGFGRREMLVRINALSSEWGEADLAAAIPARPDAILVPKVSTPEEVEAADRAIARHDREGRIALWVMMETALGILNARDIAASRARTRLAGFVIGTNDLAKELRCTQPAGREPLLPSLAIALLAARANGLAAIDGVFNDIQDTEGFAAVCRQGAGLGFDGKTLIHPTQIDAANDLFAPNAAEVLFARRVIAAFDAPESEGKGVLKVEGRMAELLHLEEARRLVALADAIADARE